MIYPLRIFRPSTNTASAIDVRNNIMVIAEVLTQIGGGIIASVQEPAPAEDAQLSKDQTC